MDDGGCDQCNPTELDKIIMFARLLVIEIHHFGRCLFFRNICYYLKLDMVANKKQTQGKSQINQRPLYAIG